MTTPEAKAREEIDRLLKAAGWVLQNMDEFNRNAGVGVAVREFSLPSGPCDYLLFIDGKAAGVVEAKPTGHTLSGVSEQSDKYMSKLPDHLASWSDTLLLDYESTGDETFFRDMRDPTPRSRRVFAFHRPETLRASLLDDGTLRSRLAAMPSLDKRGLRDCQIEAIDGLEESLAKADPRALIQMATGSGKTFTACTFSYRLLKFAKAKRILFLVDRNNLGEQTLREYQGYQPPDDGRHFSDLYVTQQLKSPHLDKDASVVITTIQRLYAMLRGEELDEEDEEGSAFEAGDSGEVAPVDYNPDIPIEMFDIIITDECHRSIYGQWRQVLEYFDAFVIGLTATPSKHTLGFFAQNLVSEYPYERSVVDGVNVGYEIYRIRTKVGEAGGTVDADYAVPVRDKRTRKVRYQQIDDDLPYTAEQLDRSVTVPNQIRAVLQAYSDSLPTKLFPGRNWVPKTLIFAKDDNHAEEIVHIAREVFGEGNDFCKKITYRTTGDKPRDLIQAFRNDPFPRIAVTVDMIATGTDIKPVEVVMFLRDVKSELYFEQMKGRGCRTMPDADLLSVTPDAGSKTRFVLIDAVGVTETNKTASQPLERKKGVRFDKLLDQVAQGLRDDDALSSLAGRLAALDQAIDDEDRAKIRAAADGKSPADLAGSLLDAIDPDTIEKEAGARFGATPTDAQYAEVEQELKDIACAPFDDANFRNLLKEIKKKTEIVIDEITTDEVILADYDLKRAEETTTKFRDFIEANKDELLALQILYSQPYRMQQLTYAAITDLSEKLTEAPWHLTTAEVWQAYRRLDASKVAGAPSDRMLTDIISLIRFATGQAEQLEPFRNRANQLFELWIGRQKNAGREFSVEQLQWLRLIRDHIAANAAADAEDFKHVPAFTDRGGLIRARQVFGDELDAMLADLNGALVA
ncbi:MAG: type I restriction-modification enzyme R subunit C-terminal domain-containing protein [Alphaproteobacteria bacterium]